MHIKIATFELLIAAFLGGARADPAGDFRDEVSRQFPLDRLTESIDKSENDYKGLVTSIEENKKKMATDRDDARKKKEELVCKVLEREFDHVKDMEQFKTMFEAKLEKVESLTQGEVDEFLRSRNAVMDKLEKVPKASSEKKRDFDAAIGEFKRDVDRMRDDLKRQIDAAERHSRDMKDRVERDVTTGLNGVGAIRDRYMNLPNIESKDKDAVKAAADDYTKKLNDLKTGYDGKSAANLEALKQISKDVDKEFDVTEQVKSLEDNWKEFDENGERMKNFEKARKRFKLFLGTGASVGAVFKPAASVDAFEKKVRTNPLKDVLSGFSSNFKLAISSAGATKSSTPSSTQTEKKTEGSSEYNWSLIIGVTVIVALVVIVAAVYFMTVRSK